MITKKMLKKAFLTPNFRGWNRSEVVSFAKEYNKTFGGFQNPKW